MPAANGSGSACLLAEDADAVSRSLKWSCPAVPACKSQSNWIVWSPSQGRNAFRTWLTFCSFISLKCITQDETFILLLYSASPLQNNSSVKKNMTRGLWDSLLTDWKKGCEMRKQTLLLTLLSLTIPQTGIPMRLCSTKPNTAVILCWAGQQEKQCCRCLARCYFQLVNGTVYLSKQVSEVHGSSR